MNAFRCQVSAVVGWVKKLIDNKSPKIQAKDIGIITPYRKQVQKVRPILPVFINSYLRLRCTRLATSCHPYSVHLSTAGVNQYLHSFIPYTGKLWNSLPLSIFPPVYDLNSFKRECQYTSNVNWTSNPCFYFSCCLLYRFWRQAGGFFLLLLLLSITS